MTNKDNTRKKRIVINPTPKLWEKIEHIRNERGYQHRTQVVIEGINMLYDKVDPPYNRPISKPEKVREETKDEFGARVCMTKLGGTVKDTDAGEVCEFYKYSTLVGKVKRYKQQVPIRLVDESLVATQYSPSRAKVEELEKKGKADYVK